jgi:predicted enzyme related to lactoylglutathione lyase
MNVVNWFEIAVRDMKRAKAFYSRVLGCELKDMKSPLPGLEMASFPSEMDAPNASGALVKMEGWNPGTNGTIVYFRCDDLAKELGRVETAGGKVHKPKTPIGEYGFIAHLIDSEGNMVGLQSMK